MGFPFYLLYASPLLLLIFFLFCLVFVTLICMCLGLFLLGFILYGTVCASWTWLAIFFSMLGKFSTKIEKFFHTFLFLFFFWGTCDSNVGVFDIVPEVSETILNSLHSFYFILLLRSYLDHFIFQLTESFFCFWYSAIDSF